MRPHGSSTHHRPATGSLAAGLGTPSFQDSFNYSTNSDSGFLAKWVPQIYSQANYAGAGTTFSATLANIVFVPNAALGINCLCLKMNQTSASVGNGGEILSSASFGYGTYEFWARFGSTSSTPSGAGSAVSGGVSSTFLLSQTNGGGAGYVEIDSPECEGQNPTWAEYDVWYNSDSSGNTEPGGGNFTSQGSGNDSYLTISDLVSVFHYYGFIWSAGRIDFYLDGVLQGSDTSNIPTPGTGGDTPGIDINHYSCNDASWGGLATTSTQRYSYCQSVKYWV